MTPPTPLLPHIITSTSGFDHRTTIDLEFSPEAAASIALQKKKEEMRSGRIRGQKRKREE
jgi:hypothetical protein